MKKFVLNALNVLGWIGEILLILTFVIDAIAGIGLTILFQNQNIRKQFIAGAKAAAIKQGASPNFVQDLFWIFIWGFIETIILFLIVRYARLLVKNLKNEIYFAEKNLVLLKRLLISFAVYTVSEIGFYIWERIVNPFANLKVTNFANPYPAISAVIYLAVFYVVFLVFKYGLQLQNESDSII